MYCQQSGCRWIPDKNYEDIPFEELQNDWLVISQRVLGGWWIDYIPKCLCDKLHYIEEIYYKRDERRREPILP